MSAQTTYRYVTLLGATLLASTAGADGHAAASTDNCHMGTVNKAAPSELAQFSFLIGDWSVDMHRWQTDQWSPPRPQKAFWRGRYALGGMAIYDEWFDIDPAVDASTPRGANLRMFDTKNAVWQMTWLHTQAYSPTDLSAKERDGNMVMWQNHPEGPSWEAEFEVVSDNQWVRTHYALDEDGKRSPLFRLVANRTACRD
ncbi:MAG: hypothetical protein AAF610_07425 [Pseudomonadota bacterium]